MPTRQSVGMAYTKFADKITTETQLIKAVKKKPPSEAGAIITGALQRKRSERSTAYLSIPFGYTTKPQA